MPGSDSESESDGSRRNRPPLRVKITGYRMLTTALLLICGIWKAAASLQGKAVLSTGLDFVGGVVLALILYWLGVFETSDPPCFEWFFHRDYASTLIFLWRQHSSTGTGPSESTVSPLNLPLLPYLVASDPSQKSVCLDEDSLIYVPTSARSHHPAQVNEPASDLGGDEANMQISKLSRPIIMFSTPPRNLNYGFSTSLASGDYSTVRRRCTTDSSASISSETSEIISPQINSEEHYDVSRLKIVPEHASPSFVLDATSSSGGCPSHLVILTDPPAKPKKSKWYGVIQQDPTLFSIDDRMGVPLSYDSIIGLDHGDAPFFQMQVGAKVSYVLQIKGCPRWSQQKHAKLRHRPRNRREVLQQVMEVVESFLGDTDGVDFGPGGIQLADLHLVEIQHIARSSFGVILAVRRDHPLACTGNVDKTHENPSKVSMRARL